MKVVLNEQGYVDTVLCDLNEYKEAIKHSENVITRRVWLKIKEYRLYENENCLEPEMESATKCPEWSMDRLLLLNNFTKLGLVGKINICNHFQFRFTILRRLQDILVELELSGIFHPSEMYEENWNQLYELYEWPSPLFFSKLERFTFSMDLVAYYGVWLWYRLQPLIVAIRNVTTIELNAYSCDVSTPYVYFLQNLQAHRHLFTNLKIIGITFQTNFPELFDFLANYPEKVLPLKTLNICGLIDVDCIPNFEKLLWKHSLELELLGFGLSPLSGGWTLNLPIFPRLKEVHVSFEHRFILWQIEERSNVIMESQLSEQDVFCQVFPVITSLILSEYDNKCCGTAAGRSVLHRKRNSCHQACHIDKWQRLGRCFGWFLPFLKNEEELLTPCTTLRFLDIPYIVRKNENEFFKMKKIANFFPRVHNKWINKIRNQ